MKVLALAASNSHTSINRKLVSYATNLLPNASVTNLDISDYEMPIYSPAREQQLGQPEAAQQFRAAIAAADALVISFAEHNGSYTAAFKNLFDWTSRIDSKVYQGKRAVFLSTSPGSRGGATVLETAVNAAPNFDADVVAHLAVPSFNDNFDTDRNVLKNEELDGQLKAAMHTLHQQFT